MPYRVIEHRDVRHPLTVEDSELPFIGSIARGNRQLEPRIIGTRLQSVKCLRGSLVHERTATLCQVLAG